MPTRTAPRRPAPLLAAPPSDGAAPERRAKPKRAAKLNGTHPRVLDPPPSVAEEADDAGAPGSAADGGETAAVLAAAGELLRSATHAALAACLADPHVRRRLRSLAEALLADGPADGGVAGEIAGGNAAGVGEPPPDAAMSRPPRTAADAPAEARDVPAPPPARPRSTAPAAKARPAMAVPTAPALPPGTGTGRAAVKTVKPVQPVPFPAPAEAAGEVVADDGSPAPPVGEAAEENAPSPSSGWEGAHGHRPAPRSELEVLPDRLRLKAKAARWAAAAAARTDVDHAELRREAHALEDEARELGTWLWTTSGDFTPPEEPVLMKRLVESFEVTADAVEVLREAQEGGVGGPVLYALLNLGAEAQSMLRAAVRDVAGDQDRDQVRAYVQIKEAAAAVRHYVRRHLREEDPADPACAPDLARRLMESRRAVADAAGRQRVSGKAFGKLRHVAGLLDSGAARDPRYQAGVFAEVIAELLGAGVPPSDRRFRDVLPADPAPLRDLHDESLDRVLAAVADAPHGDHPEPHDDDADHADPADGPADPGPADGPASLAEAVATAERECGDSLAFALNRRSEVKGSPFEATDAALAALRFLGTTFRDAKRGAAPCPDLDLACREACGFHYSGHQSETTMGQFPEFYETTWDGETVPLKMHLKRGCNNDPRHTLRIAFHWDEAAERVVVGFIGQHQRTRQT